MIDPAAHCLEAYSSADLLAGTQLHIGGLAYTQDAATCGCDVRGIKVSTAPRSLQSHPDRPNMHLPACTAAQPTP